VTKDTKSLIASSSVFLDVKSQCYNFLVSDPSADRKFSEEVAEINNSLAARLSGVVEKYSKPEPKTRWVADFVEENLPELVGRIQSRADEADLEAEPRDVESFLKLLAYSESKFKSVQFSSEDPKKVIDVAKGEAPTLRAYGGFGEFDLAPESLRFPAYSIVLWSDDTLLEVSTPFGDMPSYAVDKENQLFAFRNVYFVNEFGQGYKYEEILPAYTSAEDDTHDIKDTDLDPEKIPKLGVSVDRDQSRVLPMSIEDYKKVNGFVDRIKSAEFKLSAR